MTYGVEGTYRHNIAHDVVNGMCVHIPVVHSVAKRQ